jgi:hypothetical protein
MADDDTTPKPWTRIQYPWERNINPGLQSRSAYDNLVIQQLGDAHNPDPILSRKYGRPVYRRGDQKTGTPVFDFGKNGSYARNQIMVNQSGQPQPVDYPLRPLFEKADAVSNNPWAQYGDTQPYTPADGSLEARLKRAALIERWGSTQDVDPTKFNQLKTGDQILAAMREDLAKLRDKDINSWAQLGASVVDMTGEDLRKNGINPAYQDLLKQVQRGQQERVLTMPTANAPENPLAGVIANDPGTAVLMGGVNALISYFKQKPNLTQFRTSLPQDHNKVRLDLYDEVNNTPNGKWAKGQVDYANSVAAQAEKEFGHDQDPFSPKVSKPVEEPTADSTAPAAGTTPAPGTTPTPTPTPTPAEGDWPLKGVLGRMSPFYKPSERLKEGAPATSATTPSTTPATTPTPTAAPTPTAPKKFLEQTPQEVIGNLWNRVMSGGPSTPWWTRHPTAPMPAPSPVPEQPAETGAPVAGGRAMFQYGGLVSAPIARAAPTMQAQIPSYASQAELDAAAHPPGTRFHWQPTDQEYITV